MHISTGNHKMHDGFMIWNLPSQKTCIGCTPMCIKRCYAKKAERLRPNVRTSREHNYLDSHNDNFVNSITGKIKRMRNIREYFRIHESGDFYNQEYLDKWIKICKNFPQIKFLAFTKSYNLDFSKRPKNMKIVISIFPDTTSIIPEGYPLACAGDSINNISNKFVIKCSGLCDNCKKCWSLKRNYAVHFPIH